MDAEGAKHFAVAIPLGQGQVFNQRCFQQDLCFHVAIPLGQGQVFNLYIQHKRHFFRSQSLWVRDRFLIASINAGDVNPVVAIPLGQGQVFNYQQNWKFFGTHESQSLWVRDRFLILLLLAQLTR